MTFEDHPEVEFEYTLAHRLGMPVWRLRQMPQAEFTGWRIYFARKAQREELERLRTKGGTPDG